MGEWTATHITTCDEWAAEHLPPEPEMSRAEVDECAARLSRLHQLEGAQSEVLMAWAITVMHERGPAARSLLRMLRSLEAS